MTIKNQKPFAARIFESIDAGENAIPLDNNFVTTLLHDISQQGP
jgi:hypothetical protein